MPGGSRPLALTQEETRGGVVWDLTLSQKDEQDMGLAFSFWKTGSHSLRNKGLCDDWKVRSSWKCCRGGSGRWSNQDPLQAPSEKAPPCRHHRVWEVVSVQKPGPLGQGCRAPAWPAWSQCWVQHRAPWPCTSGRHQWR